MKKDLLIVLAVVGSLFVLFVGGIALLGILIFASISSDDDPNAAPETVNLSGPAKERKESPANKPPARPIEKPVEKKPAGSVATLVDDKEDELQQLTETTLASIAKAKILLQKRDYAKGIRAYDDAIRKFYRVPYKIRAKVQQQTVDGLTHQEWAVRQSKRLNELLKKHATTLVAEYQQGMPDEKGALAFLATARRRSVLRNDCNALQKTVDEKLMELARRRLRVEFSGTHQKYQKSIEAALSKRWPKGLDYELVFTKAPNYRVNNATWKRLRVTVTQKNATYKSAEGAARFHHLPRSLQLRFQMSGNTDVPTNWRRLPDVYVETAPPSAIDLNDQEQMKRAADQLSAKLGALLGTKISKIPMFTLFPDVDLAGAKWLKTGNRLDFEVASAILYRDRKRFDKEFGVLLELDRSPVLRGDLVVFILRRDLGAHSKWVARKMGDMSKTQQRMVLSELRKRPAFGNYSLSIALMKQHNSASRDVANLLGGWINSKRPVFDAFVACSKDSKHPKRAEIAMVFLQRVSQDKLLNYGGWIQDPDPVFAGKIYGAIVRRDRRLANELVQTHYDKASSELKQVMLANLRYDTTNFDRKVLSIVTEAAKQDKDAKLKLAAYTALRNSSRDPDAWKAGAKLSHSVPKQERYNFLMTMISTAYSAQPKLADEWMLDLLQKGYRRLAAETTRKNATKPSYYRSTNESQICSRCIQTLMSRREDRSEVLKTLAKVVAADKNDLYMQGQIVDAISRSVSQKQFKLDSPKLVSILKTTAQHSNSRTRRQVYAIMIVGHREFPAVYGDLLKKARKTETDTRNKQAIDKALQAE